MLQKASPAHEDVKYSTYGQGISCTTASRSSAPTLVRECSRPREHARVETIFLHLPVELARIVFLFCLPDAPFVTHHRREAPLNISGVCRFWRAVALATPELWSSLRPCMTSRESMRTAADTIGSWLSRCAPHPFRLALSFDKVDPPSECGLEIIAPTYSLGHVEGLAARLSSFLLSLRAEDLEGAREQLRFLDGDAEPLEHLSITACSSPASSFTSPPLSKLRTFRSMPRLRSFTLRTDVAFRASSFDVPWAQLTELTLCRHAPAVPLHSRWTKTHNADVLAVLRACPRLVSCTVYLHADSDALRTPAPTVHLPHLQTLRLDVDAVLGMLFWLRGCFVRAIGHVLSAQRLLRSQRCLVERHGDARHSTHVPIDVGVCGMIVQQQFVSFSLKSLARRPIGLAAESSQQSLCLPQRFPLAPQHLQCLIGHLCDCFALIGRAQTRVIDELVRRSEWSQQLLELDFAERIILDRLQVSLVLIVGRSGRHGLAVGIEERRVRVNSRTYVAGVVDLSAVGRAARSVEATLSGEMRTALELVAAVCVGGSGVIVIGV